MIRLLIADDQAVVRAGLGVILGLEDDIDVVGEAADGVEAVQLTRELRPDAVCMDIRMPGMDGIAATRAIAFCAQGLSGRLPPQGSRRVDAPRGHPLRRRR
ncbi:response regulator [Labedella populi]|uniref:response regulator n=1 Tax=Labedella populi TaxID=2498850 RepID=UPI00140C14EC|nr:response regulator [Labedella populi]